VKVQLTGRTVEIFVKGERIAVHILEEEVRWPTANGDAAAKAALRMRTRSCLRWSLTSASTRDAAGRSAPKTLKTLEAQAG
jgi:hypothetical protein